MIVALPPVLVKFVVRGAVLVAPALCFRNGETSSRASCGATSVALLRTDCSGRTGFYHFRFSSSM